MLLFLLYIKGGVDASSCKVLREDVELCMEWDKYKFFFQKKKGNLNLDFVFILLYLSLSFWNIFDLLPFPGNELKFFFLTYKDR